MFCFLMNPLFSLHFPSSSFSPTLASHILRRERKGLIGHAATIELSPRQKLAVINEIRTVHRLHLLSWSRNYVTTCLVDVSILLSNHTLYNCIPRRPLVSCSVTRPFLSVKGVACETLFPLPHFLIPSFLHVFFLSSVSASRLRQSSAHPGAAADREYAFEMACSNIRYGEGVTREVGMDLENLGVRNVCVLTDKNVHPELCVHSVQLFTLFLLCHPSSMSPSSSHSLSHFPYISLPSPTLSDPIFSWPSSPHSRLP